MSPHWLATLAPDPAVPARDEVLDASQVGRRLPAALGLAAPFTTCRLIRAKYRIGESVRAVYRVGVSGSDYLVSARSFSPKDSGEQFDRAVRRAVPAGPIAPVAHEPDLGVVWWTFPNDRRLDGLSLLVEPARVLNGGWRGWSRSEIVQVVPERSATARAIDAHGTTIGYAKLLGARSADPAATVAARLALVADGLAAADVGAHSPSPLAFSDEHGVVLQQVMSGHRWADLDPDAWPVLLSGLGRGLAAIHGLAQKPFVDSGLRQFERLSPERVSRCAVLVGVARPDVAAAAARIAGRLLSSMPADVGPDVVLHGDVHPGNALLDGGRVAIIDIDQAGLGPAATDIASLIARMRFGVAAGHWDRARADTLVRVFVDGYADVRPLPDPDATRWLIAAALVAERALRAVNRVNVPGLASLGRTLDLAEAALEEAPW